MGQDCEETLGCLILAAGEAKRMGSQKLLLELGGKPILQHVVDLASSLRFKEVVAVLGGSHTEILRRVDFHNARVIVNPDYKKGLSTSLKLGLSAFTEDVQAFIVMLGDQPLIRRETLRRLVCEHVEKSPLITVPRYQGRRGNPVILDRSLLAEIREISGDVGAKPLLERHREGVLWVEVDDPGVVFDVDTPQDYQALLEEYAKMGGSGRPL